MKHKPIILGPAAHQVTAHRELERLMDAAAEHLEHLERALSEPEIGLYSTQKVIR